MKIFAKNKFTRTLCIAGLSILMFIALAIGIFANSKPAKAATLNAGWTGVAGATIGSTDGDGYTAISVAGWGQRAYYNQAVTLDGLTVYHKMTSFAGSGFVGFGFGGSNGIYPPESQTFMVYYRRSIDWDFLYHSTSHDSAATGSFCAFANQGLTTTNYGIDSNRFYGLNKSTTLSISIKFTQVSGNVYAMDIEFLAGTAPSGRNKSTRTYFDATKAGISNGKVYVFAIGEAGNGNTLMKLVSTNGPTTGSAGWTSVAGATIGATSNGYTAITTDVWGERAYYKEAVTLNGLTVHHKMDAYTGDGFVGFGLAGTTGIYPPEIKSFMIYYVRSVDWDFLYHSTSHDSADTSSFCAFADKDLSTTNYGIDGNRFYALKKSSSLNISVTFTLVSGNIYAMDIRFLAGTIPNGGSVNVTNRTYFDATKAGITNGKVYVYTFGSGANGATQMKIDHDWATYDGQTAEISGSSVLVRGTYGYAISSKKFSVTNFETTISIGTETNDWMLFGLTKNSRFSTATLTNTEYPNYYGVYLLIRKTSSTDYYAEIYNFRPITNSNTTSINYFDCQISTGLQFTVGSNKQIKIRAYPDITGNYVDLEINGSMLNSNRLRKAVLKSMFGSDLKANMLLQTCSSTTCSYYINTINNKNATASNVTTVDSANAPTYKKTYTILWKNWNNSILETDTVNAGVTPTYDGSTPTKSSTAQYKYTFKDWHTPIVAANGDMTYVAEFNQTVRSYTITWKDGDGNVIETDSVKYGATPTYDGATPTKTATAQYTYTFKGWDSTISAVTGAKTYTATFNQTARTYTITWKNADGTTLETDTNVAYGATPTYNGATPTKTATAQYTYTFKGWSPAIVNVTGNATYTAEYSSLINAGASLSLGGDIAINFYINVNAFTNDSGAYFVLTYDLVAYNNNAYVKKPQVETIQVSELTAEEDGRYSVSLGLVPAQIDEKVSLVLYNSLNEECYSTEYAILDYCEYVIANSIDAELVALCKALVNYASYAQIQFGYNAENPANSGKDFAEDINSVNADAITSTKNIVVGAENFELTETISFMALNKSAVRFYYTISEGSIEDYEITVSEGYLVRVGTNNAGTYVEVYDVLATQLSDTFTITIQNKATANTTTITYSVMDFVKANVTADTTDTKSNLCKAIYQYGVCAEEFFAK